MFLVTMDLCYVTSIDILSILGRLKCKDDTMESLYYLIEDLYNDQ